MLLLHKTWSGINTWLFEDPTGLRCKGESEPINGRTVTEVDVYGTMLDVEATIGYLDDMLCFGGGCGSAIAATFCVAWEKFRNLLPVLTTRHLSPRICRKVYQAGVRSAMLHGNETRGPKEPKLRCLQCNDRVMTHWICGIKDRDKTPSASLLLKLGIEDITLVLCCRWLRWYGHVKRSMPSIKYFTKFPLPGKRKKGSPRNTLSECVTPYVDRCGLASVDPLDRDAWRASVGHNMMLLTPLNGTRIQVDGWILITNSLCSLQCNFGACFLCCFATREMTTKITLSWTQKQFATRVRASFYMSIDHTCLPMNPHH